MAAQNKKHRLASGVTRSEQAPAYHLVPTSGLRRTAKRFGLGAEVHGAENWLKGLRTEKDARVFCEEAFNHMQEHIQKMSAGHEPEDDHLGAIGWAQSVLAHAEELFEKPWREIGR